MDLAGERCLESWDLDFFVTVRPGILASGCFWRRGCFIQVHHWPSLQNGRDVSPGSDAQLPGLSSLPASTGQWLMELSELVYQSIPVHQGYGRAEAHGFPIETDGQTSAASANEGMNPNGQKLSAVCCNSTRCVAQPQLSQSKRTMALATISGLHAWPNWLHIDTWKSSHPSRFSEVRGSHSIILWVKKPRLWKRIFSIWQWALAIWAQRNIQHPWQALSIQMVGPWRWRGLSFKASSVHSTPAEISHPLCRCCWWRCLTLRTLSPGRSGSRAPCWPPQTHHASCVDAQRSTLHSWLSAAGGTGPTSAGTGSGHHISLITGNIHAQQAVSLSIMHFTSDFLDIHKFLASSMLSSRVPRAGINWNSTVYNEHNYEQIKGGKVLES